ncbi:MAG: hypothetical protein ACK6D3_20435 [Planctomycetaceae bacterium]|jgi:hypothetical protein
MRYCDREGPWSFASRGGVNYIFLRFLRRGDLPSGVVPRLASLMTALRIPGTPL